MVTGPFGGGGKKKKKREKGERGRASFLLASAGPDFLSSVFFDCPATPPPQKGKKEKKGGKEATGVSASRRNVPHPLSY